MKQGQFEQLYKKVWDDFEGMLNILDEKRQITKIEEVENFAQMYRKICHFHALAKERNYSSFLVDRLGELIVRGHQHLYRRQHHILSRFIQFFVTDFPRLLRREQKLFWIATTVLYGPALILTLGVVLVPELVYTMMGPGQVMNFESMYNPENRVLGSARDANTNWEMFGFYIYNNISVSFRTFASGLLGGVGSIFFLSYNGLIFGAVAGHLINAGYDETFFTFVIAHGSFELTAIVISGAAGLRLGISLINPGNLSRKASLMAASKIAIQLIYGVIVMLVLAAFVEAFWSSNNYFAPWQKYLVGAALWVTVIAYFVFSGRRYESR